LNGVPVGGGFEDAVLQKLHQKGTTVDGTKPQ
jgi:hypothetical protein